MMKTIARSAFSRIGMIGFALAWVGVGSAGAQTFEIAFGPSSGTYPAGNWNLATTVNGSLTGLTDFNTGAATSSNLTSANWSSSFTGNGAYGGAGWAVTNAFTNNWYTNYGATSTVTITGLTGSAYEVDVAAYFIAGGYWDSVTVTGGLSPNSSYSPLSSYNTFFPSDNNYLIFSSVAPVGNAITITVAPGTGAFGTTLSAIRIRPALITPTLSWATPSAITYGTALSAAQLNATSGSVAGTFVYSPASGTVLNAGNQTLGVTFTPTDTNTYNPATASVSLTVNPASAAVNVSNTTQTYSGSPESVTVTTTPTGLAVATTYNGSSTAPTSVGTYTYVSTVTNPNYQGGATGTFTILPAPTAPTIGTQPGNSTAATGSPASFSVSATGSGPFTYQWYLNGAAIANATNSSLAIGSAQLGNAGNYTVAVTNSVGTTISTAGVLTVNSPPVAVSGGEYATTGFIAPLAGQSFSINAVAAGSGPLTYQWYKNGAALAGQTGSSLSFSSVQASDAADYTVKISNSAGSVTSGTIPLVVENYTNPLSGAISISTDTGIQVTGTINGATGLLTGAVTTGGSAVAPTMATIASQANLLVPSGSSATLVATAGGNPTPTYQWYLNGTALSGQTGYTLTISNAQASNAGQYTFVATNSGGSATSAAIGVSVGQFGTPTGPVSIATSGGTQIAGTVDSAGVLSGTVTTGAGSGAVAPQIGSISSQSGLLLNQGASATLTVAASGNPAPTYQWYLGGTALSGQTSASLTLTNVQSSDAGSYTVTATNSAGSATSAAIPVTVIQIGTGTGPIAITGGNGTVISGTVSSTGALTGSVSSAGSAAPQIAGINEQNDLLVTAGGSATLSVTATGSPAPTYQWYQNGTALSGQTASSLTISNAQASNAGAYTVAVTNSAGSVTSSSIGVTVAQIGSPSGPLSIATSGGTQIAGTVAANGVLSGTVTPSAAAAPQISGISSPSGLLLNQGGSATLTVAASGNPAPTYQWYQGTTALAGQTASSLTLTNVQPSNAGSYSVTATNSAGSASSTAIPVTVIQIGSGTGPISIAGGNGTVISGTVSSSGVLTGTVASAGPAAPQISGINDQNDLLITTGGSATLSVVATGAPTPAYQWYQNGVALAGQTGSSLTISNAQASNAGSYTVTAANSAGSITSSSIGVTVAQIGSPSGPLSIATSGGTLISGTVTSNGVLSGSVTPGATSGGAATPVAPQISGIGSPSGLLVSQGATATLTIAGSGNPPPQYQWFFNGSALAGQTGTSLTLTNAQPANAGTYTVVATNSGGSVTSGGFVVSVDQIGSGAGAIMVAGGNGTLINGTVSSAGALMGSVTSDPTGAAVAPLVAGITSNSDLFLQPGDSAALTVFATGSPAPVYQWFRNGFALAGQTGAILQLTGVRATDAGDYTVTATNSAGTVTSSSVGVTVGQIGSGAGAISISTSGGTQVNATVSSTGVLAGSVTFNAGAVSQAPAVAAISGTPDSILVQLGSAISFSATATGTPVPVYQWYKNGAALAGQTGATFTLASAQATDAGNYTVVATNSAGSATSAQLGVSVGNIGSDGSINVSTSGGTVITAGVDPSTGLLTGGINTGGPGSVSAPSIAAIASTPSSLAAQQGSTATLTALATGVPAPAFQWYFNGGILAGQTGATLTLSNLQAAAAGSYTVSATNAAGSTTSNAIQVTVYNVGSNGALSASTSSGATIAASVNPATGALTGTVVNGALPTAFSGSRLTNLSSSMFLAGGGQVTQGFVITSPKQLLVRAVGPGLAQFGYSQVLAAPTLQIQSGSTIVASNSGVGASGTAVAIAQAAQRLGAFPLAASGMDAAVITSLPAGEYTISVGSATGGGGQVLVEIYDTGSLQSSTGDIANFSSRAAVPVGGVASGGIVVSGTSARNLLIRAVGPTLGTAFGLGNVMPSPVLRVLSGSTLIVQNSGWSGSSSAAQVQAAAASVGAFPLPAGSADSAAVVTLQPGSYTVQVADAKGGGGAAMIEVYELP